VPDNSVGIREDANKGGTKMLGARLFGEKCGVHYGKVRAHRPDRTESEPDEAPCWRKVSCVAADRRETRRTESPDILSSKATEPQQQQTPKLGMFFLQTLQDFQEVVAISGSLEVIHHVFLCRRCAERLDDCVTIDKRIV